jgi:hypothetical protein
MTPFEFSAVFDRIITRRAQDVVRNWESNQKFTEFLLCEKDPKGVCPGNWPTSSVSGTAESTGDPTP